MNTKSCISFLLNGEAVTIDFSTAGIKPSTTILNWLRNEHHHSEVKEGCAEGDCGACTVVIGEPDVTGTKMIYRAVNSCLLFLPSIDGKLLITSRGLSPETSDMTLLHPVQKAIAEEHATQCGFCTPGFVMSLFALYHKEEIAGEEEINNALSGNLCRCTGYDSIKKAAHKALSQKTKDSFSKNESLLLAQLNKIRSSSFDVTACEQHYMRPVTLSEALELKRTYSETQFVCGSTDAALAQSKHFRHIPSIIDISGINEIKTFRYENNTIHIGAGLSLEEIRASVKEIFPPLFEILSVFASRQIRNLATMGGNLGSASPIGDTTPLLMASDASLTLTSNRGQKIVPIRNFITGYRQTVAEKDELISEIHIPVPSGKYFIKAYKVSKRHDMDISTVSAAFRLEVNNRTVKEFCAYFGGMAAWTKNAEKTSEFLKGKEWNEATVKHAMKILETEFSPISDARSSAEFRNIAASGLLMLFFNDTKGASHEY